MTRVDSAQLRPRRRWYAVAAAIAVLGLLAGTGVLVVGIRAWIADFPTLGTPFRAGEPAQVDLRAGQPAVLYVSPDTSTVDWRCTAEPAGATGTIDEVTYTFTFVSGGRTWAARYEMLGNSDGRVTLTCVSANGTGSALLAVGNKPDNAHLLRVLGGSIAAGGCTALLGVIVGGVLAVVIARRRGAYRRRLEQRPVHSMR